MGLDAVEIVLRCEELFSIHLADDEAAAVRTVDDLYRLICTKLDVTPLPAPVTSGELPHITDKENIFLFLSRPKPLPAPPEILPWSAQTVWDALVAIFVDQMGLKSVADLESTDNPPARLDKCPLQKGGVSHARR